MGRLVVLSSRCLEDGVPRILSASSVRQRNLLLCSVNWAPSKDWFVVAHE